MPVECGHSALFRLTLNLKFLLAAPRMIFEAYQEFGITTFAIPTLKEYQILACSYDDIKFVCESSEGKLSFNEAMTDASVLVAQQSTHLF